MDATYYINLLQHIGLTPRQVNIIEPADTAAPGGLAEMRNAFCRIIGIKAPPELLILPDTAYEASPILARHPVFHDHTQDIIILKSSTAADMLANDPAARFLFCHALGHLKQWHDSHLNPLTRRQVTFGMLAGGGIGGSVGYGVVRGVNGHGISAALGASAGTATGMEIADVMLESNRSERIYERELNADRFAHRILRYAAITGLFAHARSTQLKHVIALSDTMGIDTLDTKLKTCRDEERSLHPILPDEDIQTLAVYRLAAKIENASEVSADKIDSAGTMHTRLNSLLCAERSPSR